ncbi:hypothetical protein CCMSSC00406_0004742 [Pleurotus cornucopiae]|uniref:Uncharacterized protein n=1 Tax=Pleurotus cornucopiae TaxID=5321 RepID=A0ACB7J126_PLECO|nr:hypothetical protein CCMSSC00406_0004742 [Pleurotus cornucopiae]
MIRGAAGSLAFVYTPLIVTSELVLETPIVLRRSSRRANKSQPSPTPPPPPPPPLTSTSTPYKYLAGHPGFSCEMKYVLIVPVRQQERVAWTMLGWWGGDVTGDVFVQFLDMEEFSKS